MLHWLLSKKIYVQWYCIGTLTRHSWIHYTVWWFVK